MLCRFAAKSMGKFAMKDEGEFDALTVICSDHPIWPVKEIHEALL